MSNYIDAAKNAFLIESECLKHIYDNFDEDAFKKAVDLLDSANKIGTAGCGHSGIICNHFAHLLRCIDKSASFIYPSEAIHGAMGFLSEGDVMVFASRGGRTGELLPIIDICKKKKIKILSITENPDSEIAKASDAVIKMYINRETDRYNAQGTTSSTVLAVIFQAIQAALIEKNEFNNSHFAVNHPGGAVGERLNGKKV